MAPQSPPLVGTKGLNRKVKSPLREKYLRASINSTADRKSDLNSIGLKYLFSLIFRYSFGSNGLNIFNRIELGV